MRIELRVKKSVCLSRGLYQFVSGHLYARYNKKSSIH
jgi:hypothetical protein